MSQLETLAEIAKSEPQSAYTAFTSGFKHRMTYFMRTIPNLQEVLQPLDDTINTKFIPAITEGHNCSEDDRRLLALPVRLGGLGLPIFTELCEREFRNSTIIIEEHVVEKKKVVKYVGDPFNQQGTNKDLIEDRVKKGQGRVISIISMCEEASLGKYLIQTLVLLYHTVFLKVLLFNCQAWSHLTNDNFKKLQTIQLKFLKRIMAVPQSTPNCFVYLELGILPIRYEIHTSQLIFLYHILTLNDDDPVRQTYIQCLKLYYEDNWANRTRELIMEYGLLVVDEEIMLLSRDEWKSKVEQKVQYKAFRSLQEECETQKKTRLLHYKNLSAQPYMKKLNTKASRLLFRIRCRMVPCKVNHKSSHSDLSCRAGCTVEESQEHLLNCPIIHPTSSHISTDFLFDEINVTDDIATINLLVERMQRVEEYNKEH